MAEPLSPFVAWLHRMMRYLPHLAILASLLVYAFFVVTEQLFTKPDSAEGMTYVLFPYDKYERYGLSIANGYNEYLEADRNIFHSTDDATKIFSKNMNRYNIISENNFNRLYLK